ncbi:shikimate dehydrogenase family protein [Caldiplasma sukawensis]
MYGLLGNPVYRSWSEYLFNRIFEMEGRDEIYCAMNVSENNIGKYFKPSINCFNGYNVTSPFKKEVMKYLWFKEERAWAIGNVNTIVRIGDHYHGFNTDYFGVKKTFESNNLSVNNKNILILGGGNLSDTVKYYLITNFSNINLKIMTRNPAVRENLKNDRSYISYSDNFNADIIINCTTIGMTEDDIPPIKENLIINSSHIIDLTYQRERTKLLRMGEKYGKKIYNGRLMFFEQAYETYRVFFQDYCKLNIFENAIKETIEHFDLK